MENKTFKYLATICFALYAVCSILGYNYLTIQIVITIISSILVVIALLAKIPMLSTVGFALMVLAPIINCVIGIERILEGRNHLSVLFYWLLYIATCILLMFVSIAPKYAKSFGIIAAGLEVIGNVAVFSAGLPINLTGFKYGLVLAVGAICLGLAYSSLSPIRQVGKTLAPTIKSSSAQSPLQNGNVEKLLQLKALHDKGVITQEEFNEKKKELLNL